jgi:hypothetical protein
MAKLAPGRVCPVVRLSQPGGAVGGGRQGAGRDLRHPAERPRLPHHLCLRVRRGPRLGDLRLSTPTRTVRAPGTRARTGGARSPTDSMAGSVVGPRITRRPAPTRVAPRHTVRTSPARGPRPTTPEPGPPRAPPRAAMSMAGGGPPRWCGATTGPGRRAPAAMRAAPRPSAPRAAEAPSWHGATTTCMSQGRPGLPAPGHTSQLARSAPPRSAGVGRC